MHPTTLESTLEFAKQRSLEWKSSFGKLYDMIYDYCSDNKSIYVYSITQTLAYLKKEEWKPSRVNMDYTFVLLSKTPVATARQLTQQIMKEYSPYVSISASVGGLEQVISVDNVRVVSIALFLEDIETDVVSPWYYITGNTIQLLQPIMSLFFLSRELYHPSHLIDALNGKDDLLTDVKDIVSSVINNIGSKVEHNIITKKDKILVSCIDAIKEMDLNNNIMFAGVAANGAIQICASRSIDIAKVIVKELRKLKGIDKSSYMMSTGFVMGDFRLKRVSVHVHKGGRRIHVASVFNNLSYEAIPYVNGEAHPFVALRFWLYGITFQRFYSKQRDELGSIAIWANIRTQIEHAESVNKSIYYKGKYRDDRVDKIKMGMSMWRPKYEDFTKYAILKP